MASDDGDDDAEGADAADDGCEGVMGNGSNCYDYKRCIDSNYDEGDGKSSDYYDDPMIMVMTVGLMQPMTETRMLKGLMQPMTDVRELYGER